MSTKLTIPLFKIFKIPGKDRRRSSRKPWITKGILKSIGRKERLYKRYLKLKNPSVKKKYTSFRNMLTHIIRVSKKNYFAEKLESNRHDLKNNWKTLNNLLGKNSKSKLPSFIRKDGVRFTEAIANAFNSFFANAGCFDNRLDAFVTI